MQAIFNEINSEDTNINSISWVFLRESFVIRTPRLISPDVRQIYACYWNVYTSWSWASRNGIHLQKIRGGWVLASRAMISGIVWQNRKGQTWYCLLIKYQSVRTVVVSITLQYRGLYHRSKHELQD